MKYNTIIIGAGPTGLALSYLLQSRGLSHVVLERSAMVASSWRGLWNNFTLATPMSEIDMIDLNSKNYPPDYKMTRDQAVELFEDFHKRHRLPIEFSITVKSIQKSFDHFTVITDTKHYAADHIVICIGPRHYPKYPERYEKIGSDIYVGRRVMHSSEYKRDQTYHASHTLVVGSGLSCLQIAEDILTRGRSAVSIACGRTDEEIFQRNGHISALKAAQPLEKLKEKGIQDYGRLLEITDSGDLKFSTMHRTISRERFDTIIFATGYRQDFYGLLNDLARQLPSDLDIYNGYGIFSQVPGLFFAGMPGAPGEYTATISAGTQDAKAVLVEILKRCGL